MPERTTTRRRVLATLPAIALAGCASDAGGDPTTSDGEGSGGDDTTTTTATPTTTEDQMTPTDDGTPTRQELVEQLPEPSPLSGALTELVGAQDRTALAAEYSLDFRDGEHDVRVQIELEEGGTFPEEYRVTRISTTGNYVTAYVHVNDLVPLAMADDVRKVQRPPESRTQSGST